VLNKRPNVDLINPPGRAGNYYLDSEINKYFKHHPKTKPNEIVPKTLEVIRKNRPIFSTQPLDQIPKDSITVPYGMIYQLIYRADIPTKQDYLKKIATYLKNLHPPTKTTLTLAEQNLITSEIPFFYSVNMLEIGNFLLYHYKDPSTATHFYKKAIDIDAENSLVYAGLGLGQLYSSKDCDSAKENVEKAVKMYPIYRPFYAQLYIVYSQCNTKIQIIKALEQKYSHNFKEKIKVEVDKQKKLLEQ
jgi:tetratricopeptide (TPR) repeat protein